MKVKLQIQNQQQQIVKKTATALESYLGFPPAELEDTQEAFLLRSAQTVTTGVDGVYEKKKQRSQVNS